MAFTVDDFEALIRLLGQHPEWRAELRRHVLSDDLIELPSLVRQLAEAQSRNEIRLERVESRLEHVESRLERVEGRLDRVETALVQLTAAQTETAQALHELAVWQPRVEARLGELDGRMLEFDFNRKGPAYLTSIARRLRVIESGPLVDILDDAVDERRLTDEERNAILRADVVLSGRRRSDGQDVYLVVEVLGGVRVNDVERAAIRAGMLTKVGRPVLAVVAGRRIFDDAAELARALGVWYADEVHVTPPPGA